MIDTGFFTYFKNNYTVRHIVNGFGVNPDCVSYVKCNEKGAKISESDDIKQYLNSLKHVEGAGYFTNLTTLELDGDNLVSIVVSDYALEGMGNLKLTDSLKECIETDYDGKSPVLLGYDFKDKVELGKTFTLSLYEENDCIVVGFLPKGAAWVKSNRLFGGTSALDAYTLDKKGILLTKEYERYNNTLGEAAAVFYVVKDGHQDEVYKQVMNYAIDKNYAVGIINEGEEIAKELEENNINTEKERTAALFLTILAVISIAASNIVYCLMNKKQYGIMMVSGVTMKDIKWLVYAQVAVLVALSGISVWFIRQMEIFGGITADAHKKQFELFYLAEHMSHDIMVPVVMVLSAVLIVFLSSVIPITIIKRMRISEMIAGKN